MGNLYDVFFYKTGAGTALVSWLLLGIDDLGMQLEQPYTVMALKSMCEDVQDEVVPETGRSEWTPRIGAPRDEVKASVRLFYLIFVWAIRLTCNFFLTGVPQLGVGRRRDGGRDDAAGERVTCIKEKKRARARTQGFIAKEERRIATHGVP